MRLLRRKPPEPHVPFISLADIAWQLIIFFLVTSAFIKDDAMNIELPNGDDKAASEQETKTITVKASEQAVIVDETPVPLAELEAHLRSALAGHEAEGERVVVLQASDDLTFQRDVEIMAAIKRAGGIVAMLQEDDDGEGQAQ